MKLYRSPQLPDLWIGEDAYGALVQWPAASGGWQQRTPYAGPRRALEAVEPALARGTGWPGVPTGRPARAGGPSRNVTIRAAEDERAAWERAAGAAGAESLSEWGRRELNAAAARPR